MSITNKLIALRLNNLLNTDKLVIAYFKLCREFESTIINKDVFIKNIPNYQIQEFTNEEKTIIENLDNKIILEGEEVEYIMSENRYLKILEENNLVCPSNIDPERFVRLILGGV